MTTRDFVIIIFAVVVAVCIIQLLYSETLGVIGARMIGAAPGPVRRFYDWANFRQPLDGPFWNRARRNIGAVVGSVFLVGLVIVAIR